VARRRNRYFWFPQFSLRILLLSTLVLGALAGVFGPSVAEMMRQWDATEPSGPWEIEYRSLEPMGYFESAESPLR
jgi:hypothetical protein